MTPFKLIKGGPLMMSVAMREQRLLLEVCVCIVQDFWDPTPYPQVQSRRASLTDSSATTVPFPPCMLHCRRWILSA